MRSPSLRARLERLEAVLKPPSRVFCMVDLFKGPHLAEREEAFRSENSVGLHDTIMIVRWASPNGDGAGHRANLQPPSKLKGQGQWPTIQTTRTRTSSKPPAA